MLPKSMRPDYVFPHSELNEVCICPNCSNRFVLGNGVAYKTLYKKEGERGIMYYGDVCFCSLECVLWWLPESHFSHC